MFSDESIRNTDTFLISHGHLDHIGCLDTILNVRSKASQSTVVMPLVCISNFKDKMLSSYLLDNGIEKDDYTGM